MKVAEEGGKELGGIGADGADVDAATAGVYAGDHEFVGGKEVVEALVDDFADFFVEVVFVAEGDDVAQQGFVGGKPLGGKADVDGAPVGLVGDFAVAAKEAAADFYFAGGGEDVFFEEGGAFFVGAGGQASDVEQVFERKVGDEIRYVTGGGFEGVEAAGGGNARFAEEVFHDGGFEAAGSALDGAAHALHVEGGKVEFEGFAFHDVFAGGGDGEFEDAGAGHAVVEQEAHFVGVPDVQPGEELGADAAFLAVFAAWDGNEDIGVVMFGGGDVLP